MHPENRAYTKRDKTMSDDKCPPSPHIPFPFHVPLPPYDDREEPPVPPNSPEYNPDDDDYPMPSVIPVNPPQQ